VTPYSFARQVWEEETMKALASSVKHARYAMGSLTAVLFATSVGSAF
jgi:type IV secretory pathway TrbF-like protein